MKIYIKNMVCNRCILVVKNELEKLGFQTLNISLGEVELKNDKYCNLFEGKRTLTNSTELLAFLKIANPCVDVPR